MCLYFRKIFSSSYLLWFYWFLIYCQTIFKIYVWFSLNFNKIALNISKFLITMLSLTSLIWRLRHETDGIHQTWNYLISATFCPKYFGFSAFENPWHIFADFASCEHVRACYEHVRAYFSAYDGDFEKNRLFWNL